MSHWQGETCIDLEPRYDFSHVVPVADLFLPNDSVWVLEGKRVLYIDDDHLSSDGAKIAKNRVQGVLEAFFLGSNS